MKKTISFISFLTITIIVLSVVQVVVSNRLSTTGITLSKLQDKISTLRVENTLLSEELYIASSLTHIASAASELGFIEPSQPIVIAPLPLAIKP